MIPATESFWEWIIWTIDEDAPVERIPITLAQAHFDRVSVESEVVVTHATPLQNSAPSLQR